MVWLRIADGVLKDLNVNDGAAINDLAHIYSTQVQAADHQHLPSSPSAAEDSSSYEGPQHDPAEEDAGKALTA